MQSVYVADDLDVIHHSRQTYGDPGTPWGDR
jgi:hypothetical protein